MNSFFETTRIFVVAGPGGVGKTTLSAAFGLALSERYRTLVLTVDPSKRLRQLLGVSGTGNQIEAVGTPHGKTLHVSCLDVETYFDRVVDRFAPNAAQAKVLKDNPLYQTMTSSLGGTQEYAAMERLWELAKDPTYEKIIIDTPPAQNAVDLLLAPGRLADLMEGPVFAWFAKRTRSGPIPWLQSGTRMAMALLQKVFGGEFLDQLGGFFRDMEGLRQGFLERHREIHRILRQPETGFILVSRATESRLEECKRFFDMLASQQIAPAKIVLNRVEPPAPKTSATPSESAWTNYLQKVEAAEATWLRAFEEKFPTSVQTVPMQRSEPENLDALTLLGRTLVD